MLEVEIIRVCFGKAVVVAANVPFLRLKDYSRGFEHFLSSLHQVRSSLFHWNGHLTEKRKEGMKGSFHLHMLQ